MREQAMLNGLLWQTSLREWWMRAR